MGFFVVAGGLVVPVGGLVVAVGGFVVPVGGFVVPTAGLTGVTGFTGVTGLTGVTGFTGGLVAVPVGAAAEASPYEEVLTALERTQGLQILLVVDEGRTVGAVLPADIERLVRSGGRPKFAPPVAAGVQ